MGNKTCKRIVTELGNSPCLKYATIRVFSEPYFPLQGQNRRENAGKCGSEKNRVLVCFTELVRITIDRYTRIKTSEKLSIYLISEEQLKN